MLYQRRTTSEPAIKIPFAVSSFAVNIFIYLLIYLLASPIDVPLKLGKMQFSWNPFLLIALQILQI